MGVISPYFSDSNLISILRAYFNRNEQYKINFKYWLNNVDYTEKGIIVRIKNRKFLVDKYTGSVLEELR